MHTLSRRRDCGRDDCCARSSIRLRNIWGPPLKDETWLDWDEGGVANQANSKLVYRITYTGNAATTDTRDGCGTGQNEYESENIEIIKESEWNRDDLTDATGTRVVIHHDG